jgi:hypothetical protein
MVEALAPAVVASIALQQFLELLDPFAERLARGRKKELLAGASLVVALLVTWALHLRVLAALGVSRAPWLDPILTALLVTGGTKGFNDILKFVNYKKEQAKQALGANR